ncbi:MAG TPA: sensor histidine kinase [Solirubrobacteraceae bacterium]|nr:sensor histidine kinase [Solirubrobacteraceae bacterium]
MSRGLSVGRGAGLLFHRTFPRPVHALNSHLAAGISRSGNLLEGRRRQGASDQRADTLAVRLGEQARRRWERSPLAWRFSSVALLGVGAAAGVAYATAHNPAATPVHVAALLRILIILTPIAAGLYAQTSRIQARMGGFLIATGLFSAVWLLNGSSNRTLFSVGVVCSGAAPLAFAYLMLVHPTGHLPSRVERRFLALTGGTLALLWLLGVGLSRQPPLKTPLLECAPSCPSNAFSLGSGADAGLAIHAATVSVWLVLTLGTPILLWRRLRSRPVPVRRSLAPVLAIATAAAALLISYLISINTDLGPAAALGSLYIGFGVVIPLGVLLGLSRERLFMGQTLAEFVNQLAGTPQAEPEALMAAALRDPSLRIAYRRPGRGTYVDATGAPVLELAGDRAVTWIERNHRQVAAVMYDRELADYQGFVRAAGAAALIRLESAQLEADLRASTSDLAASRVRLMEMAAAERRRLERDLHDGVQQHLVSVRIRLALAAETVKDDPAHAERLLTALGKQMDDLLNEVRSLARGIYPSVLSQYGLIEALRAVGRSSTIPVEVRARRVTRYTEDMEVAVYFCCLEALQNVAKHAGPGASATVKLRQDGALLYFEVRDFGAGFSPQAASRGSGLSNMRDRIEAVGGTLEVSSGRGQGTLVRGSVPVA